MKQLSILWVMVLSFGGSHLLFAQASELATVYIYFKGEYNGRTKGYPVYLNDTVVGYLKEGVKVQERVRPGRIAITGRTWLTTTRYFRVTPNSITYIRCMLEADEGGGRPELVIVDSATGAAEYNEISYERESIRNYESDDSQTSYYVKNAPNRPLASTSSSSSKKSKLYSNFAGGSVGINNITGVLGPTYERVFMQQKLGIVAGAGIGTWGYKLTIGARYYFKPMFGSTVQAYYTYVTGGRQTSNYDVVSTTGVANKPVTLLLHPVHVITLSYAYIFKIAGPVRAYLEIGIPLVIPTTPESFTVLSGDILTEPSKQSIEARRPGNFPMIGFGVNVGF